MSDIKLFLEIVIFLMNQEEEKEKQKKIFSKKSRQRSHWHSINGKQWKEAGVHRGHHRVAQRL